MAGIKAEVEHCDVLTNTGQKTGFTKPKRDVHTDGDYHRAVHMWIFAESTQEFLLQQLAVRKGVGAGTWDMSSAGHVIAGESSLGAARRELHEEIGVLLPSDAFELLFIFLHETDYGKYINNEFADVYLVTTLDPIPVEAFTLRESEVSAVKYMHFEEYKSLLDKGDSSYVPQELKKYSGQLFDIIAKRYKVNIDSRSLALQKHLSRYSSFSLSAELMGLAEGDKEALVLLVKAGKVIDEIFHQQMWYGNPTLRDWFKEHVEKSDLDKLKWKYYTINKIPWSCLDENVSFITTADSAIKLIPEATKIIPGWKGLEYRTAFPMKKPPVSNFYPPDMDKMKFEQWKDTHTEEEKREATRFFSVVKRLSELDLDKYFHDLHTVPYSAEYKKLLTEISRLLH